MSRVQISSASVLFTSDYGLGKGMHPSCYGYELNNTADRNIFPREEILEKENSEHNIKNSEHWGFYH